MGDINPFKQKDYISSLKRANDIKTKSVDHRATFVQHILLVASSTFGIVVSLSDATQQNQQTQTVYFLAIGLLGLSTLLLGLALADLLNLQGRLAQLYQDELYISIQKETKMPDVVGVSRRNIFVFGEKLAYILIIISFGLLITFKVMMK